MRAVLIAALRRKVPTAFTSPARGSVLTQRFLAIAADVGYGSTPAGMPTPFAEKTQEQQRAALAEYQRITKATARLSETTTITPACRQELKVAFHYWVGARSRSLLLSREETDVAMQNAESLLAWMLEKDVQVLQDVVWTDECPSGGLVNMMEHYLLPFRGTHQSFLVADKRLRQLPTATELKLALKNATRVMERLQKLHDDPTLTKLVPDRYSCNMVLNLWLKRCWFLAEHGESVDKEFIETNGASSVQECLDAMQAFLDLMHTDPSLPAPEDDAYTLVLSAWVHSKLPNRAEKARAILDGIEKRNKLNSTPYNAVIYAYASLAQEDPTNCDRAVELLTHMKDVGIPCKVATYSTVLLAYTNSGQDDKAMKLLNQMEKDAKKTGLYPNVVCYNTVLTALAKSGKEDATRRADSLLQHMQHLYDENLNPDCCPDVVSYTSVIQAWSRADAHESAERAQALLEDLSAKDYELDVVPYNIVLDAWSRHSGRLRRMNGPDDAAARRAESILQQMKENAICRPDNISYNTVMNTWAKSGVRDKAGQRAREVLQEMKEISRAGDATVKPDVITYNIAVGLIARSGMPGCVDEAYELLKEMGREGHTANTITYNTVLDAAAKSGEKDSVQRAEALVAEMEEKYKSGNTSVRPNEITYNTLLHAYAKSNDPKATAKAEKVLNDMLDISKKAGRVDAAPSVVSFSTVLDGYAKTGQVGAAESLFQKMISAGNIEANTVCYNTVLNALSTSSKRDRDAPNRAEELLNRMQREYEAGNMNARPNSVSFSSLLNCWAKSQQDGAAEHAEAILLRMEQLAKSGQRHVQPNVFCYSAVLNAWSRSRSPDAADRALSLLNRMEEDYRTGQGFCRPNSYCYNTTINAIAKGRHPDKAAKAYDMLHRMIQAYKEGNKQARPCARSFSTVLNACAFTHGTPEENNDAFRIARTTFVEFIESDYGEPTVVTYVNFLNACSRLLPPGPSRDALMSAVFIDCSKRGLVNGKVVTVLRLSVSPDAFQQCESDLEQLLEEK